MLWLVLPLAILVAAGGGPAPRVHSVEIRGMAYHPAELSVAPGDTIVWINRDIVPHTATGQGTAPWDTGHLVSGASGRYVPRRVGTLAYICALHPTMRATLIVKEQS